MHSTHSKAELYNDCGMSRGCLRVLSLTNQLLRYQPSLQLQERLVGERKAGTAPNTLLVVQVGGIF